VYDAAVTTVTETGITWKAAEMQAATPGTTAMIRTPPSIPAPRKSATVKMTIATEAPTMESTAAVAAARMGMETVTIRSIVPIPTATRRTIATTKMKAPSPVHPSIATGWTTTVMGTQMKAILVHLVTATIEMGTGISQHPVRTKVVAPETIAMT